MSGWYSWLQKLCTLTLTYLFSCVKILGLKTVSNLLLLCDPKASLMLHACMLHMFGKGWIQLNIVCFLSDALADNNLLLYTALSDHNIKIIVITFVWGDTRGVLITVSCLT